MQLEQKFATFSGWATISGMSRRTAYRRITKGDLRAVKSGKRTLIDVEHGLAWLRSQPRADVNCR